MATKELILVAPAECRPGTFRTITDSGRLQIRDVARQIAERAFRDHYFCAPVNRARATRNALMHPLHKVGLYGIWRTVKPDRRLIGDAKTESADIADFVKAFDQLRKPPTVVLGIVDRPETLKHFLEYDMNRVTSTGVVLAADAAVILGDESIEKWADFFEPSKQGKITVQRLRADPVNLG